MNTVRTIMQTDVVTVSADLPVERLARLLADRRISGVPVVDDRGRPIGVVSATDLVRLKASEGPPDDLAYLYGDEPPWGAGALDYEGFDGRVDGMTVGDIMTPITFSIEPDATVAQLADFLTRGRIHRAVVRDGARVLGIVTTLDVLRWVAGGARTRGDVVGA